MAPGTCFATPLAVAAWSPVAAAPVCAQARPGLTKGRDAPRAALGGWDLVRRAAAAAGAAGVLLGAGGAAAAGGVGGDGVRRQVVASASAEVEAAAFTLGVVGVGGLVVKGVMAKGRDTDKERREVEAACEALRLEEEARQRRRERRKMEAVELDGEGGVGDDVLLEDFMSRVRRLESGEGEDGEDEPGTKDAELKASPLPDRGASGSMVLDRPDAGVDDSSEDAPVDAEKLEMLRRMWKLDVNDKDRGTGGTGAA